MNNETLSAIKTIVAHAKQIISGSYKNVDDVLKFTDPNKNSPEINELAETFAMMSVKVEAREFDLEQKISELQEKNKKIEELGKIRTQLSNFVINILLIVSIFIFSIGFLDSGLLNQDLSNTIRKSPIVEIGILLLFLRLIIKSGMSLKNFGLNLANWKKQVTEAIAISLLISVLLAVIKYIIVHNNPDIFIEKEIISLKLINYTYLTYIFIVPIQEFITRGIVQGSFEKLFDGKYNWFWAIVVTTFLFGALHSIRSFNLAIASFVTSWLWGWMFYRHKSLLGCSISHFLIGDISAVMGYWQFF